MFKMTVHFYDSRINYQLQERESRIRFSPSLNGGGGSCIAPQRRRLRRRQHPAVESEISLIILLLTARSQKRTNECCCREERERWKGKMRKNFTSSPILHITRKSQKSMQKRTNVGFVSGAMRAAGAMNIFVGLSFFVRRPHKPPCMFHAYRRADGQAFRCSGLT